jgi:hypothetical protein
MLAAMRTVLRPPSAPTSYSAHLPAVGEMHDPAAVLSEASHLEPLIGRHTQVLDPTGQDPLHWVLPQAERVRVPCRKVAHVQRRVPEERRQEGPALGEEPAGNPALVEDFDRPRVEPALTQAHQLRRRSTLHNQQLTDPHGHRNHPSVTNLMEPCICGRFRGTSPL